VDQIDLIQLHNLVHPDDWDTAMGDGGALEAAVEAREQGLVRFIGVTGHGLTVASMHRRSLEHFDFDSVLLPYNVVLMQDERYASDFNRLMELCRARNVAVQTIKGITRGPWGSLERTHSTWYQPLEAQEDIDVAVHWVLGEGSVFLNTAGDVNLLPKILDAASRYTSRPDDETVARVMRDLQMSSLFA
jgi:predicted aldo/keto reductase-like oxidoreductase